MNHPTADLAVGRLMENGYSFRNHSEIKIGGRFKSHVPRASAGLIAAAADDETAPDGSGVEPAGRHRRARPIDSFYPAPVAP